MRGGVRGEMEDVGGVVVRGNVGDGGEGEDWERV